MVADTKKCFNCKVEKPINKFYQTKDDRIFKDGYYHLCNDCIVEVIGNELNKNVASFLQTIDVPLLKEPWAKAMNSKNNTILEYLKITKQVKYKNKSYTDSEITLGTKKEKIELTDEYLAFNKKERAEENKNGVSSKGNLGSDFTILNNGKKIYLTDEIKQKWLIRNDSFNTNELLSLEKYFMDMQNAYSIENISAINLLYELSILSIMKERALRDEDFGAYDKLDKSFQNKLKDSGFRPIDEKDSVETTGVDSLGQMVAQIERDIGFIPPNRIQFKPDEIDLMLTYYVQWAQRLNDQAVETETITNWRSSVDESDVSFEVDQQANAENYTVEAEVDDDIEE